MTVAPGLVDQWWNDIYRSITDQHIYCGSDFNPIASVS